MALEFRKAQPHDFPARQKTLELYHYEPSDIWPQDADAESSHGFSLERHRQGERLQIGVAISRSAMHFVKQVGVIDEVLFVNKHLARALCALGVAVLSLGLFGCGGGSGASASVTTPDAGTNSGPVTKTIGTSGGTHASSDRMLSISIPPGGLAFDTAISITKSNDNLLQVGAIYTVSGPGGTDLLFTQPVTVTLNYDPSLVPPGTTEKTLRLALYSPYDDWEAITDSVVDTSAHAITATTLHFSAVGIRQSIASAGSPLLGFPLLDSQRGNGPYTAQISSIFDHAMTLSNCPGGGVVTYTGESGTIAAPSEVAAPVPSSSNCGSLFSYYKTANDHTAFRVNEHYVGVTGQGANIVLNYDGHNGIDYPVRNEKVYAANTGKVLIARPGCWNGNAAIDGKDSIGTCYGQVQIQDSTQPAYVTYYLHLSTKYKNNNDPVAKGELRHRAKLT